MRKELQNSKMETLNLHEFDEFSCSTGWMNYDLSALTMEEIDFDSLLTAQDWTLYNAYCFELALLKEFKSRLREMKLRMLKPLISLKRLKNSLVASFSLLFGLCSSESSVILSAYFGTSLSRIPNLY